MSKMAVFCLLAALLLPVLAACAQAKQAPAAVQVSCEEFEKNNQISRAIEVPAGSTFTLSLCSNPTTGFGWEEAKIADGAVVKQASRRSEAATAGKVGSPGQEVWTFSALKQGETAISMAYSRPWQGGEKGVWTVTLTVRVK